MQTRVELSEPDSWGALPGRMYFRVLSRKPRLTAALKRMHPATSKDGISALSLQRTLEIGSYQTAVLAGLDRGPHPPTPQERQLPKDRPAPAGRRGVWLRRAAHDSRRPNRWLHQ